MKYSRSKLIEKLNLGKAAKYIFFWGNAVTEPLSKSCFSQWYPSVFIVNGHTYHTAEHWMMAEKARLFKDKGTLKKILECAKPGEAKKLGREVRNFNHRVWEENKYAIVVQGSLHKFSQNDHLKIFLLNTGERVLVEASPIDPIWGIGMAQDHSNIRNPYDWKGENLLGFALMEARDILRNGVSD